MNTEGICCCIDKKEAMTTDHGRIAVAAASVASCVDLLNCSLISRCSPVAWSKHASRMVQRGTQVQSSRMVQARKSTIAALNSEPKISQHNESKTIIGRSHSSLLLRSICSARVFPSANNLARALKPCHMSPLSFVEEGKCMDTGIVSLADILGIRIADHVPQTPNKIFEDMIKGIAAMYIRLRDVSAVQRAFLPSPCSSFSSGNGIWSPRCRKEGYIGMAGQFIQLW